METVISGRLPFSRGKTGKADVEKSAQVLEQFGLSDYAFRQMGQLSGGERQRILIARALAGDPQVLLLDEPTSSLDLRYQYEVMEFLVKVSREKNLAVVAVIHDLNLALDFADRVALLHDGHVLAEGATKEVITPDRIEKAPQIIPLAKACSSCSCSPLYSYFRRSLFYHEPLRYRAPVHQSGSRTICKPVRLCSFLIWYKSGW